MMTTLAYDSTVASYLPIMLLVTMTIGFAVANVVLTLIIGPKRDGAEKGTAYESGMNPIGTARKKFNIRFYLIAMVFLVFDIEIVFLYPWAATFANLGAGSSDSLVWLARILFFMLTTIVAYIYCYRKGVFKFD